MNDNDNCFVIDNDQTADWALRKVKEIEQETEEWTEFYKKRIQNVIDANEIRKNNLIELLGGYFGSLEKVKETKTQFSYELPSGKLILKKEKSDFNMFDKIALTEQLQEQSQEQFSSLLRVKVEPDWATIKKGLKQFDDKIMYITEDGEALELHGVDMLTVPERFEVK